ncbi:MAG: ATP-dependent sacrificial sulfur transferase LarE [Acidimicrobiales bacterium]|jgi:uncharacterized protein
MQVAAELAPAAARLERGLSELGRVVVGFSGGADSALLAYVARQVLGRDGALCVTAVSSSLAPEERADCEALAAEWDLDWRPVETNELASEAYARNGGDRCYHCKSELMSAIEPIVASSGAVAVLGVNLDDLSDHRPGQAAAAERGARFPLLEAGLNKTDVRALSRELGLRTADKPAAACLASRVPYGTRVTVGVLSQVAVAESGLRALGFQALRVRHYGELARVELPLEDLPRALRERQAVVAAVRAGGYRYVTLDLDGLRSGNLNGVDPSS